MRVALVYCCYRLQYDLIIIHIRAHILYTICISGFGWSLSLCMSNVFSSFFTHATRKRVGHFANALISRTRCIRMYANFSMLLVVGFRVSIEYDTPIAVYVVYRFACCQLVYFVFISNDMIPLSRMLHVVAFKCVVFVVSTPFA